MLFDCVESAAFDDDVDDVPDEVNEEDGTITLLDELVPPLLN